jgi:hypothetical protein
MNAIATAAKLYCERGFVLAHDIQAYLAGGYVLSTPERLLLWRPVNLKRGADQWLTDQGEADAWFVHLAVGSNLAKAVREMPYYLPFIAWRRSFKRASDAVHVYRTERIIQLTGAH